MKDSKKKIVSVVIFVFYFIANFLSIFTPQVVSADSLPLNITIKTSETEVQSGRFVDFNIKYEVLNHNQIKEGDTLVIEIPESLTNVTPVYSKQHFKSMVKTGNKLTLTFGANASTALAGYIGLGAIAVNDTTKTKDATVKVKYGEVETQCNIAILPLSTGVAGKEIRSIVKFTPRQSENYVQDSASSGIMYPGCSELEFFLEVNPKLGKLNNVVVKDFLPYETELIEDSVKIKIKNGGSYTDVPENTFPIVTDKNYLQINFGDIEDQYRVFYKVKVLRSDLKISNSAKIEYEENGEKKIEMQDFYLKPYNYSGAINGYKTVDKSIISNKSEDQTVIYTLRFENDNVFSKDSINLTDKLDKRIKFVDAISTEEFAVTYDPDTHTVSIKNSNGQIPAGMRKEVKIITDFSDVKPGETVNNTVGANTTVTRKTYDVRFKKTDSITGQGLPGAVFKVLDNKGNEILSNIVTDENGEGIIELSSEGNYSLQEVKAPNNYVLDDSKISFTIDKSSEGIVLQLPNVNNDPEFSQIGVKKVDEDNPSKVLPGAEFQLMNKGDNTTYNEVTDVNGIAQFQNLKVGTYILKEVKAPTGYALSQEEQEVVVTGEQKLIEITKSNKLINGSVSIKKVDSQDKNKALQGAKFEIKNLAGDKVAELTTGEDGLAVYDNLPYGEYKIVEVEAPQGYKILNGEKDFKIETDGQSILLEFTNELIQGEVIIEKVDSEDAGIKLKDAHFQIMDKNNNLVKNIITGEDGIGKASLIPGNYTLVETKAPAGYVLDKTPIAFEVTSDVSEPIKIQAKNKLEKGEVTVIKVDMDDNNKRLQGAEFQIKNSGGEVVDTLVSSDSGTASSILLPGKYTIQEIKAPEGYILSEDIIPFEITAGEKTAITLTVKNKLDTGKVMVKKVDDLDSSKLLPGAEFNIKDTAGNIVTTIKTGEEGSASATLVPGSYTLVETKAPLGYELSQKEIPFIIEKGQTATKEIKVENSVIKGEVEITKVDKYDNSKVLLGAEFNIKDSNGNVVTKLTTDKEGKATAQLIPGEYTLEEIKAPENYELSKEVKKFSVVLGGTSKLTMVFENKIKEGTVIINKVDAQDKNILLEGAIFTIKDKEGKLVAEVTTDKDGVAKLILLPGEYIMVEKQAPIGYKLSTEEIKFNINPEETKVLSVDNTKIIIEEPTKPEDPDPTKPDNSGGEKPGASKDTSVPTNVHGNKPKSPINVLPKTGGAGTLSLYVLGTLTVISGLFMAKRK